MAVILLTGMSGAGKSTALAHLASLGHRTIDTDTDTDTDGGGWIALVPQPDGTVEPLWREDRVDALLTEHERTGEHLFLAGTVRNQGRFYPRFAEVVLLSAPLPTMLARVAGRRTFGGTEADRARIAKDTAEVEPLLRASATVEVDTAAPVEDVVRRLVALVAGSRPPPA